MTKTNKPQTLRAVAQKVIAMTKTITLSASDSAHYSGREIVALCLAPLGFAGRRVELGTEAEKIARGLADGFGKLSITNPADADMLWDWSHVRDSSPQAFSSVVSFLRAVLEGRCSL